MNMWKELTADQFTTENAIKIFKQLEYKEVPFRFMGASFYFSLSQSLFSSFDIDKGTKLLLKSIATKIKLKEVHSILDIGCGVGVLGITLTRHAAPNCQLVMEDRDALALLFSTQNGLKNKLSKTNFKCQSQLMFEKKQEELVDLLVSNIPAKAGQPVIQKFLKLAPSRITPNGIVAIVIVHSLSKMAKETILQCGYKIHHTEKTHDYQIFHFKSIPQQKASIEKLKNETIEMDTYFREHKQFRLNNTSYFLKTATGLPHFDQPGFALNQMQKIIPVDKKENIIFINPEQGHLPVLLSTQLKSKKNKKMILISSDRLSIKIAENNLQLARVNEANILSIVHFSPAAAMEKIEAKENLLFFNPEKQILQKELQYISQELSKILKPNNLLILAAKSSDTQHYQKELNQFSLVRTKKSKGFRALLLKKH